MARLAKRLGVPELVKITTAGRHAIGSKLYLELTDAGHRNWLIRYRRNGKPTWMSLGRVDTGRWAASLVEARQRAQETLDAIGRGEDPQQAKRPPAANGAPSARVTFWACAEEYLNSRSAQWTNERYARQVEDNLRQWTASIARRSVADVSVSDVKACLAPHWRRVPVTAQRMREHIAAIFELAIAQEWRVAANPATVAVMNHVLGSTDRDKEHMAALPWKDLPSFVQRLEKVEGAASLCLQFAIVTAARTSEARDARWSEIDLDAKLWVIPKGRMKKRRAHSVPLCGAALSILKACPRDPDQPLVFGSLGSTALYKLLTRECGLKPGQATVHGMRSAFADWCADNKVCTADVADAALAHVVKNKTTRAYKRTDYLEERRGVMDRWGTYLILG